MMNIENSYKLIIGIYKKHAFINYPKNGELVFCERTICNIIKYLLSFIIIKKKNLEK